MREAVDQCGEFRGGGKGHGIDLQVPDGLKERNRRLLKWQEEGPDIVLGKDETLHLGKRNQVVRDSTEGVVVNPWLGLLPEVQGLNEIIGTGVSAVGDDLLPSNEEIHGGEFNLMEEVLSCSR